LGTTTGSDRTAADQHPGKCAVFSGAGVGGGSLIYGSTLYEPLPNFYTDKQWAHITDWKSELAPYYDQAQRMLCVAPNPRMTPADEVIKEIADDLGVGHTFHATNVGVVFAGAALGTQKLLHKMRDEAVLPDLSPQLGELIRSNSEAILNVVSRSRRDFADGIAITSSIHPGADTHIEVCHYGKGQNALFPMSVPIVDGGAFRFLRFLLAIVLHPVVFLRSFNARHGSEKSVILLLMQSLDNSLTSFRK
jgi:choline dehydrogenase-like flavoprotein